jgi:hypothetical protein
MGGNEKQQQQQLYTVRVPSDSLIGLFISYCSFDWRY